MCHSEFPHEPFRLKPSNAPQLRCKTVEEEKCAEVKEGYTTSLKCDKVRVFLPSPELHTLCSGQERCAPWRGNR